MAVIGYEGVCAAVTAKDPLIVDVRTEDEFASGRIPGATNIPLSEVSIVGDFVDADDCFAGGVRLLAA